MSNVQMEVNISGIDADAGLKLCDGDFKIYLKSLTLYVANMPANLAKMKNVSKETLSEYTVAAHGAKSISQYVGAEEARKTALQLEMLAKSGDLDGILAHNEAFIKYAENLLNDVRKWLEKNNISNS